MTASQDAGRKRENVDDQQNDKQTNEKTDK